MTNRNAEVLASFVKYCEEHPSHRFWQALRNWSGSNFVLVSEISHASDNNLRDTFYWEGFDNIAAQPEKSDDIK